jgi:ABC-type transport system involved in cytochrome bd biosynthesis fused ATPase/permease subunit
LVSTHEVDAPGRVPLLPRFRLRAAGQLDRWTFRRKLDVLVIVPITVIAVMLAYVAVSQVGRTRSAAASAVLVRDSEQVAALIDDAQNEHRQALLLSVRYEAMPPGAAQPSTAAYRRVQRTVDAQIAKVRSAFGTSLPDAGKPRR